MSEKNGPHKGEMEEETLALGLLHLSVGWSFLLVFLVLGLVLEMLHGFKVGAYLDVSNQTRRLMWTLSHAHGSLVALVNIAFGVSVAYWIHWAGRDRRIASGCYFAALVLLPFGFFLGGTFVYGGDPGLGVILVIPGGLLLLLAVFLTARAAFAERRAVRASSGSKKSRRNPA